MKKSGNNRYEQALKSLVLCFLLVITLLTLTGFMGEHHWVLDLFSHFRLFYLIGSLVCLIPCVFLRTHFLTIIALVSIGFNGAVIVPYYWPNHLFTTAPAPVATLGILQLNVWSRNTSCKAVANMILRERPDIITFEEFTEPCLKDLQKQKALTLYPYHHRIVPTAIALYSRILLDNSQTRFVAAGNGSSIVALIRLSRHPITLMVAHTTRPKSREYDLNQHRHFIEMAEIIRQEKHPVIVAGDLNTTPWSLAYRRFMARTGLKDTQKGFGIQPTWPAYLCWPWLPIDHVWVSDDFVVLDRRTGPHVGSDHLPVLIRLGLKPE